MKKKNKWDEKNTEIENEIHTSTEKYYDQHILATTFDSSHSICVSVSRNTKYLYALSDGLTRDILTWLSPAIVERIADSSRIYQSSISNYKGTVYLVGGSACVSLV